MTVLTIRTDKPEAEIALIDSGQETTSIVWQAHRQLAESLHSKISGLLSSQKKNLQDLHGIVVYKGPGSFTGLRIGLSVANALAYSLDIPVAGSSGENWKDKGANNLQKQPKTQPVVPEYGSPAHVTTPRK